MENKENYEEIQLSNVWIKIHVLDVIEEINQYEIIAKIGSSDLLALSQTPEIDKIKMRLDALDLMEAKLEILKGNVFFKIDPQKKLRIFLLLKQSRQIPEIYDYIPADTFNYEEYKLTSNFFVKLDLLQRIKESLINGIAEKGMLLPKVDEDLEEKTQRDLEDEK